MKVKYVAAVFVFLLFVVGCSSTNEKSEANEDQVKETAVQNDESDEKVLKEETNVETQEERQETEATLDETPEKEIEKDVVSKPASYLMDKEKRYVKKLTYEGETTVSEYTYEGVYKGSGIWDLWEVTSGGESNQFLTKEDKDGLYTGYPESEYYLDLAYPVEEGKTFDDWGDINTITKIDSTLTTAAGTFDHVVEVQTSDNWTIYYAPSIGHVKSVDENGETVSELIELK